MFICKCNPCNHIFKSILSVWICCIVLCGIRYWSSRSDCQTRPDGRSRARAAFIFANCIGLKLNLLNIAWHAPCIFCTWHASDVIWWIWSDMGMGSGFWRVDTFYFWFYFALFAFNWYCGLEFGSDARRASDPYRIKLRLQFNKIKF